MAYYWFYDGTNTLTIDDNFLELSVSQVSRKYKVIEYAGRNGGQIRGFGSYSPRTVSVTRKDRKTSTSETAWNNLRTQFMTWMTKPKTTTVWFYVKDSDTAVEYRMQVYPESVGADKYSRHFSLSDPKAYNFLAPSGVLERTSATTTNYSYTGPGSESFTVTNGGTVETFPVIKVTPSADATFIDVKIADNFGVRLQKTNFNSGEQVVYDCSDNSMTIDGTAVLTRQYLTAGSAFFLQAGSNTVYIESDAAASVAIDHTDRII
jgi:hypothetical protein